MVFELQLQSVKDRILSNTDFQGALTDLDALIVIVEQHVSLLPLGQQRQWAGTRSELSHSREHLLEVLKQFADTQVEASLRPLSLITLI